MRCRVQTNAVSGAACLLLPYYSRCRCRPLLNEYDTYKTIKASFRPWLMYYAQYRCRPLLSKHGTYWPVSGLGCQVFDRCTSPCTPHGNRVHCFLRLNQFPQYIRDLLESPMNAIARVKLIISSSAELYHGTNPSPKIADDQQAQSTPSTTAPAPALHVETALSTPN